MPPLVRLELAHHAGPDNSGSNRRLGGCTGTSGCYGGSTLTLSIPNALLRTCTERGQLAGRLRRSVGFGDEQQRARLCLRRGSGRAWAEPVMVRLSSLLVANVTSHVMAATVEW